MKKIIKFTISNNLNFIKINKDNYFESKKTTQTIKNIKIFRDSTTNTQTPKVSVEKNIKKPDLQQAFLY